MEYTEHVLAKGSKAMSPGQFYIFPLLRWNLEAVLTENYDTVKLMVGG